jgi:hypothetical protein
MKMYRLLVLNLLWALLVATGVRANEDLPETALWKTVGAWSVYIDRTVKYQCFIATVYEDYTLFRMGFQDPEASSALYIAIGNADWKSIESGKTYDLVMQIDNEAGWTSPATAITLDTLPTLVVNSNQAEFVAQLMRRHSLRVFFNDRLILNLSLRGSNNALKEMATCQNAVDRHLGRNAPLSNPDPFKEAPSPNTVKDPFATY